MPFIGLAVTDRKVTKENKNLGHSKLPLLFITGDTNSPRGSERRRRRKLETAVHRSSHTHRDTVT
jgi:hypothetical protein